MFSGTCKKVAAKINTGKFNNKKKRVLLVGDVGRGPEGFYHIGDEAMMVQNYLLYHQTDEYDISLLSWYQSHSHLDLDEHLLWPISKGAEGVGEIDVWVDQAGHFKSGSFLKRRRAFKKYVDLLNRQDLIHITGGGNLNSLYPRELYSRSLILLLAGLLKKPVLLTSQTIGPLTDPADRAIAQRAFGAATRITVRDGNYSIPLLVELGVDRAAVEVRVDDAFFLKTAPVEALRPFLLPTSEETPALRIGISMHAHKEYLSPTLISQALNYLSRQIPIEVYFIPHLFGYRDEIKDVSFLKSIASTLPPAMPWRLITGPDLMNHPEPVKEHLIKGITSRMDLVLTTRYHGLVFALSSAVPVLALNYDEYYEIKNNGILELVLGSNGQEYTFSVKNLNLEILIGRLNRLIFERISIRRTLRERVQELEMDCAWNLHTASKIIQDQSSRLFS